MWTYKGITDVRPLPCRLVSGGDSQAGKNDFLFRAQADI